MRVLVVMISLLSCVISQKNLSPDGTASQSSTYYYASKNQNMTADLAITGGPTYDFSTGSCSTTQNHPKLYVAWWMLTFPVDTVYITNVRIYYRFNTLHRLAGYYLYVSNSSVSKTDGHLCYHHTGPGLPSKLQNVNCNYLGKHVIFYNERDKDNIPTGYSDSAVLELCHVEVYGCYKGWWGDDCSKRCSVNCTDGHCYPGNGSCVWGCKIGQDGDMCDRQCSLGRYGYNCSQSCDGCISNSCQTTHGYCLDQSGCKPGWQYGQPVQRKCDIECGSGTFDINCSSNCHCVNQPCDPEYGTCSAGGCDRGYKGIICSTECSLGNYGYNCNQSCDGCLSDSCDKEHGVCTNTTGCKPGWQYGQPKCDKACSHGYYGYNCNESCDGCLLDSCERENGVCTDTSGCKPRRQLGQMKKCECVSGTFGNNCSRNCHCVNQPCDPKHGTCPAGGCQLGYEGITCSTECILGHYGYNCEESCDGCLLDSCDREYGVCTDTTACKPGRQPGELLKCDKACGSGTFGNHCSRNCHCVNQPCDPEDGTCPAGGCERGYKGSTCSTECTSGDYGYNCEHHCRICVNSSCERYEGLCTYGCIDGLKGLQCQSAVTPQSAGQTTNDSTMNMVYTGVGTFIVSIVMCIIIVLAILRYRRNKTHGNTTKQGEQKSRGFRNGVFTNDFANTLANNTDTHYEDTIHSDQEKDDTYDTI